jgi:hypothetical protein
MMEEVIMLMLCDSRAPLSTAALGGEVIGPNSVFALPEKRHRLRQHSAGRSIVGEVIIELERDSNLEFLVEAAVHQAYLTGGDTVVCLDRAGLDEVGIYDLLALRLAEKGLILSECKVEPLTSETPELLGLLPNGGRA